MLKIGEVEQLKLEKHSRKFSNTLFLRDKRPKTFYESRYPQPQFPFS